MTTGPLRFPPEAASLRRARSEARAHAARLGASAEVCDAVALVVDELFNNALEHGSCYRRTKAELCIVVALDQGRIALEFHDPEMPDAQIQDLARALREAANGTPALDSERGRGLFLLSIYMEELRVAVSAEGGLRLQGRMAAG